MCQKETSEGDDVGRYYQATTMIFDATAHFNANVTYYVTLHLEKMELEMKYVECVDSAFKVQRDILIKTELSIVFSLILGVIEALFTKGLSLHSILFGTPLCWLNIDQILLVPNYGDYFVWGALTPVYMPEQCPGGGTNPYGPWTKMSFKQIKNQIVQNILNIIEENRKMFAVAESEKLNRWYEFRVAAEDNFEGDDEEYVDYFVTNFETEEF